MYKIEDIQNCFETYYKKLYAQPKINNKAQIDLFLKNLNLQSNRGTEHGFDSRNYSRRNK